jgi:hypothetical protein
MRGGRRGWTSFESYTPARQGTWPQGATAGLVLVAAACAGVAFALYRATGYRDSFAPDAAIGWDAVPAAKRGKS